MSLSRARIAIYTHAACLTHDTGPGHVECAGRLMAVTDALRTLPGLEWHEAPRASRGQVARVHCDPLLRRIVDTQPDDRVALDPDTMLSPHSAEAALRAAGAGVAAVDAVMHSEIHAAFCAVRPPGHHATMDTSMGFCLFNNVAIAAAHALERHGLSRISIIDFDVHHGNGTQAIFEHDPRVQYLSTHQTPLFPGTGSRAEGGVGNLFNRPLPQGADSTAFQSTWQQHLLPEIDTFAPELLLISAGFDAHWRDPLAQLRLDAEDFAWLTGELVALGKRHAQGRIVSTLEGGYDLAAMAECALAHVSALQSPPISAMEACEPALTPATDRA